MRGGKQNLFWILSDPESGLASITISLSKAPPAAAYGVDRMAASSGSQEVSS